MIPYYFDWAATTPMSERALDTYASSVRTYRGNPSALHKEGKDAAKFLSLQRETTGRLLGVSPKQIVYTAGATEGNGIVLQSLLWLRSPASVLMSAIEHDSVINYQRLLAQHGCTVHTVKAPQGYLDLQQFEQSLQSDTRMVCVMLVNNVLGTVQDIAHIAKIVRTHQKQHGRPIHIHVDAVQSIGKIPLELGSLDIDSATFSAHKFQGPKGVGILYLKHHAKIAPLSKGGGQEMGIRAGTENIGAIAAMNTALQETLDTMDASLERGIGLRRRFERSIAPHGDLLELMSPGIDSGSAITPYILALCVKGLPSEVFTRVMYDNGFCISSGSACSNNAPGKGEGVFAGASFSPEKASSAIRISFGPQTTESHIDDLAQTLVQEAKKMSSLTRRR